METEPLPFSHRGSSTDSQQHAQSTQFLNSAYSVILYPLRQFSSIFVKTLFSQWPVFPFSILWSANRCRRCSLSLQVPIRNIILRELLQLYGATNRNSGLAVPLCENSFSYGFREHASQRGLGSLFIRFWWLEKRRL